MGNFIFCNNVSGDINASVNNCSSKNKIDFQQLEKDLETFSRFMTDHSQNTDDIKLIENAKKALAQNDEETVKNNLSQFKVYMVEFAKKLSLSVLTEVITTPLR